MLDVRTYTWKDVKNTKIVINSTGTTAKLSEFANSSKTDPIVALESVLKLYGFTNIQINNPTGRNIIFSYDSKYNFLIIQLQNLTINMNVDILNGVIYWKPFQGAATTDYKTWDITNGSLKKTFSTNGEEIYLGYVAEAMSEGSAYLWNNGKDILNQLITPLELVEAIGEGNLNEQSSFTSDIVDSYGDTIEYEYLNQIASYHTIPRYYLGNKSKSFKGISFDYNVKSSSDNITDSSSNDGQFVFDDEIKYKGGNKKDAKYWSFSPQVYPIVIFNKTCDRDLEEGYLQSVYASGLKTHSLSWKNNILNIDNKTITLQDNDLVVAYIRTPGVWTVENDTFPSWGYIWGEDYFKDFSINKGCLTCSPIKIFQLSAPANDLSFSLKTTDSTYQQFFTKKEINHDAFKSIIQTKNFTSNNVLDISNVADYVYDRNGIEFKSFGEIEEKSVWFTPHYYLKSFCDFATETWEVNNFQYVSQSSIGDVFSSVYSYRPSRGDSYINKELDGSWDPKTNYYTSCYINGKMYAEGDDGKPDSWDQNTSYLESLGLEVAGIRRHTWGHAITTFLAPVGMFPSFCGYLPNKYLTSKDSPHHEEITTYYGSNGEYYFRAERDFADYPMVRTTWLKIGYQYIVDTTTNESPETFALAIVVWRNGKLVKE